MAKSNNKIASQTVRPFIQGHAKIVAFHDKLLHSCMSFTKTKQNQISRMLKKLKTQVSKEKAVQQKCNQLQKKVQQHPTKALKMQLTNVKKTQRITGTACNHLKKDILKARQELSLHKISHIKLKQEARVLKDLESNFIKSIKLASQGVPTIGKQGNKRVVRKTAYKRAVG